jgi:SAM-dependent methyltransferase
MSGDAREREGAGARDRLNPSAYRFDYVHLRSLAILLRTQLARCLGDRRGISVVDVGCGGRPYAPLLEPYADEYVGVDVAPGPDVDVVAKAEALPFQDGRFDCLLSTQVLQYTNDPSRAIAEAWRVIRPDGVAFVSTHGVGAFDAVTPDHWRWTHTGLEKLLQASGPWARVDVYPTGGTGSAIAYLIGGQIEALAHKAGVYALAAPAVFASTVLGWNIDRLYRQLYPDRPPDLASSYLAVAQKPG